MIHFFAAPLFEFRNQRFELRNFNATNTLYLWPENNTKNLQV